MARTYQLGVSQELRGDAYFEALASATDRALETGRIPGGQYLALLIDEAHDFEDAWLRMATRLVSPESNSLLVLYDDAQSIYQARRRKFNFASVGIEARGRTSVLRLNYRNTAEVLTLAMSCAQSLLRPGDDDSDEDRVRLVEPTSAGRRGPMPVFIEAANATAEGDEIAARIDALRADGCVLQDIAVLLRSRQQMLPVEQALRRRGIAFESMRDAAMRRFDWNSPSVKLVTMHSAKGLEFRHVFVAGLQSMPMGGAPLEDEVRLLYVAMTRATQTLAVSACGESAIAQRVRQSLQLTQARFAGQVA
jgi:superfamily I DNA/RNA helicase